jgi:four helix bundle protein
MGKGRLQADFLERVEMFSDRCIAVAEELERGGKFRRVCEQLAACGSSVGANIFEASEAMSTADFRKSVSIAIKELSETRFWLRLVVRRGWITHTRLDLLQQELQEIRLILGSILSKTKPQKKTRNSV